MSLTRMNGFSIKSLAVATCLLTAASGISIPTAASAQPFYGRPGYGGWAGRPYRPYGAWAGRPYGAWAGRPAYRPYVGAYGYRPWRGYYAPAYRPAYYARPYWGYGAPYYGGYGYYNRPYYNGGGAVAAGLIGGLALGAIASAAARPAYRTATYSPYNNCFFERRRVVTRNGNAIVRRVRTCY